MQKLLRKARKGTKLYYITGNYDDFLRSFLPLITGENLQILNDTHYISKDNKRYYITHGDFFDNITMTKKWIAHLGDKGYDILLNLNAVLNYIRKKVGIKKYWSLSKYVKDSVKKSVNFINDYENILSEYAKRKNYDGVICDHIHKAEIRNINGIEYKNCGDWVENCTALVVKNINHCDIYITDPKLSNYSMFNFNNYLQLYQMDYKACIEKFKNIEKGYDNDRYRIDYKIKI